MIRKKMGEWGSGRVRTAISSDPGERWRQGKGLKGGEREPLKEQYVVSDTEYKRQQVPKPLE